MFEHDFLHKSGFFFGEKLEWNFLFLGGLKYGGQFRYGIFFGGQLFIEVLKDITPLSLRNFASARQNPRHECYYYNMEVTVENAANLGKDRKECESWLCELESLEVRLLYPTHRASSAKGGDVKPAESSAADSAAPVQKSKTIYGPVSWKFDENKALFKVQELVDCHYYHPEHTDGIFLDRGFLYMEVIFKAKDKTTL